MPATRPSVALDRSHIADHGDTKPNLPSGPSVTLEEVLVGFERAQRTQLAEHGATFWTGFDLWVALQEEVDLVEEARINIPLA
jgi:hypothetical protein